jgi:hypothetical protein
MSVPAARGLYGRHRGSQGWFPGTDPAIESVAREWLEWAAPVVKTAERLAVGDWPARRGAVWVRFVEGRWIVAHSAIPEWSHDRSIPAWAVSVVDDAAFRAAPVLKSMFDDVRAAFADPERWIAASPAGGADAAPAPLADGVLRAACSIFEASQRPGPDGAFHASVGSLDAAGWVALQAMLCAMATAGVEHAAAVVVFEPAPVSDPFPALTQCFEDGAPAWPAHEAPAVRGVAMPAFVRSFGELVSALEHAAAAAGSAGSPVALGTALRGFVPLGLVDPATLEPPEVAEWVRAVCADGLPGGCLARLDAMSQSLADPAGGDPRLAAPFVQLLAAWVAQSPADPDAGIKRLLGPVLARLGPVA